MRPITLFVMLSSDLFQSTHPMRDATTECQKVLLALIFQSTHPMRDATIIIFGFIRHLSISIHASHAGCDISTVLYGEYQRNFNPRIPCGMRPCLNFFSHRVIIFQSTHPMRDATFTTSPMEATYKFQSTHPMRDATVFPTM